MNILLQLGVILGFGFAGEITARLLPFAIPASVMALLFMLCALGFKFIKEEKLEPTANFLSSQMAFFFIAPGVAILQYVDYILPDILKLLLICIASTIAVFFVSYGTVRFCTILLEHRQAQSTTKGKRLKENS